QAEGGGWLGVVGPWRHVVSIGDPGLHEPLIGELDGRDRSGICKWIDEVKDGVAEGVVIRRQLGLNAWHRDKAANPYIHSLRDVREVEIDVFNRKICAVLAVEE